MNSFARRAALFFALTLPTLGAAIYFAPGLEPERVQIFYSLSKGLQFAWPLVWLCIWGRSEIRHIRRFLKPSLREVAIGAGSGLALGALILFSYETFFTTSPLFSDAPANIRSKLEAFSITTPWHFLCMAIFISVLHSYLEEYYWRWYVHRECARAMAPRLALMISALGFTGHHIIVIYSYASEPTRLFATVFFSAFVFVGGVIWALLYSRLKSLFAVWLSHICVDFALMWIGYRMIWP